LTLGLPEPPQRYLPLLDDTIPINERGDIYTDWVSSYFEHRNVASHNDDDLEYRLPKTSKKSTIGQMSQEELVATVYHGPGVGSEYHLISQFQLTFLQQTQKELFDPDMCDAWSNLKIWLLYGDSASWHMPHAAWKLEEMIKENEKPDRVHFRIIKGANHFVSCHVSL